MMLDVWSMTHHHVDIRLPKASTKGFLSLLPSNLTEHEPLLTNLRTVVDYTYPSEPTILPTAEELQAMFNTPESRENANDLHFLANVFFASYQPYETINHWMRLMQSLRPELVQLVSIGETFEGREILGITVKGKKSTESETISNKKQHAVTPGIILHGAQHAREWISVSTVCYIAHELLVNYYVDEEIRRVVDEFEWRYMAS
jgi:extracellular matrix protein 14